MTLSGTSANGMMNAWEVLRLFLIPIGGGIPAGVLLAKSRGIHWIGASILYFISDVILACVFEPLMLLFIAGSKRSSFLLRFADAFRKSVKKTTSVYGHSLGPLALIGIAFGVDPMTGRAVASAQGHGFIAGWMLAIAGDMIYFTVLMVSTLWLNSILGDGTWTTVIILALMMGVPFVIRRYRERSRPERVPVPSESESRK